MEAGINASFAAGAGLSGMFLQLAEDVLRAEFCKKVQAVSKIRPHGALPRGRQVRLNCGA